MADVDNGRAPGADPKLGGLTAAAKQAGARGPAPVHLWNPPFCGDIGLKITRDGAWHYRGSPIGRPEMVRLFATILRKDPEGHVLVTPVEKVSVEVEDAPFLGVALSVEDGARGRALRLRTNVDDDFIVDAEHPLRFERGAGDGVKPYALVRGDLWALLTRPLFLELVELGETRAVDGREMFGVVSCGVFFPMAPAAELDAS